MTTTAANAETLQCDLRANGDTQGGVGVIVLNGANFEAWGTDAVGNGFCCSYPADPAGGTSPYYNTIDLYGSYEADTLTFSATVAGVAYNLNSPRGLNEVQASAHGRTAGDTMIGSNAGINDYEEWLYGDHGNDTMYTQGGTLNHLHGGDDDDVLYGGNGFNTLDGDDGDDYLQGGNAALEIDIIHGGDGDDCIYGLAGDDALYGDGGNDDVLGGAGVDNLYGGIGDDNLDGDDQLGGITGYADTLTCGPHNDYYYNDGADTHDASCEHNTLTNLVCP